MRDRSPGLLPHASRERVSGSDLNCSGSIRIVSFVLSSLIAVGCGISDPGYTVSARNESEVPIVIRGERPGENGQWLLRPHSAGTIFTTLGPPREARPIDYQILDGSACRILGVQHVDFALAPNAGYAQFIIVVQADTSLRLDALSSADATVTGDLEPTAVCPE